MAVVLKIGSCATQTHEPGQVRKEAAISGILRVPQGSLVRAIAISNAWMGIIEDRCTASTYIYAKHADTQRAFFVGKQAFSPESAVFVSSWRNVSKHFLGQAGGEWKGFALL